MIGASRRPGAAPLLVALVAALLSGAAGAAPRLFVAYPPDGHTVRAEHVLFEGSVSPGATLRVNGRAVPVGPDGVFVEWLPLRPGRNALALETSAPNGERARLNFAVTSDVAPETPARLAPGSVRPAGTVRLFGLPADVPGRTLNVEARGSRGAAVTARVGTLPAVRLAEVPGEPGRFAGAVVLPPGARLQAAPLVVTLRARDGRTVTQRGALVTTVGAERVGVVTAADVGDAVNPDTTAAWGLADEDPVFFPKRGQRLRITGEDDRFYRVTLAEGLHARVRKTTAGLLPPGTAAPALGAAAVQTTPLPDGFEARVPLASPLPFVVRPAGERALDLVLYDGRSARPLRLALDRPLWGYGATLEAGALVLRVKSPPAVPDAARPLEGRRIVLDAGHGGTERGGMGALGVHEKSLTLPITLKAAAMLRALGATVILTREVDVTVPLYDRPLRAEREGADVLVSVHNNAIPDGVDPRSRRGAGVYLFQPQAEPLARALLAALREDLPEVPQDRGGLFRRSLALVRPSSQPSVLVELAYLTNPDELRLLMSDAGQDRFAAAIARGLLDFFTGQAAVTSGP